MIFAGTMLLVIGMANGVPSVVTHEFKDSLTCTTIAQDMKKRKEVLAALCVLPLVNIPRGDRLPCCTDR